MCGATSFAVTVGKRMRPCVCVCACFFSWHTRPRSLLKSFVCLAFGHGELLAFGCALVRFAFLIFLRLVVAPFEFLSCAVCPQSAVLPSVLFYFLSSSSPLHFKRYGYYTRLRFASFVDCYRAGNRIALLTHISIEPLSTTLFPTSCAL